MSKTTIVATIGPASNTAETLLALHRAASSRSYLLFARAGAPLCERAMAAFIGVYRALVLAKTRVFA
ncbi:hypothetical protein [Burkholderia vietnamiensis]|uniref:hypothetical protein n=1 Tax=Burkholderia vietnamiensis TaxID=60552 RepID=UPI000753C076|nr:hypothetical protein [Burkholderia vietnamiensis]KVF93980.1 hypothetical protein WJ21_25140 [Burkholderia vietnamiensis]MBE0631232.1 hypothetical protein [Burkholderia vietnamiensis]MBR8230251.1 hypothetical protein [Burkholderia vietnamiensis]MCA8449955.1 hypothetical protein [Burkholderia vietnamiensis]MDN8034880.1 hypothetical protein [Burkholderia vietnamiensis]